MKKIKNLIGVLLLILVVMIAATNCSYSKGNNSSPETKWEFPSRIHKKGEGFYEVGKMLTPRYNHASILLPNNNLFIVGGSKDGTIDGVLKSTEIFDFKTKKSIKGPNLAAKAKKPVLFPLKDNRILIVYHNLAITRLYLEIYNPKTNLIEFRFNCPVHSSYDFITNIGNDEIIITADDTSFPFARVIYYNAKLDDVDDRSLNRIMSPISTNFLIKKDNIFYFTVPPYGKGSDRLMKLTEREVKQFSQNPETYYHEVQRDGKRYLNFNREDIFINYQDGIAHSKGGILLNDKNSLILFGPRKIFLYDIKANKFLKETQELPPFYTESIILHTSVLKNGNVLMITAKYPLRNRLIEVNPYTLRGDLKSYTAPGQWAAITDLNNGEIVYSGGMNFSNNPYKRYKVSNKIYLWKK